MFINFILLHMYECILCILCILCVDVYVCACTLRVCCIICNILLGAILALILALCLRFHAM